MKKGLWLGLVLGVLLSSASAQVPAQPLDPQQVVLKPIVPAPAVITPSVPAATNQAPADADGPQISIAAESSLRQVLQDLAQAWTDARGDSPEVKLKLTNTATLHTWAKSKEDYDLYLDASVDDVQELTASGCLESGGQRLLARNSLAVYGRIAVEKNDELEWFDLIGSQWQKVALAYPDLTASGQAAVKALQKHDLWKDETKPLFVFGPTDKLATDLVLQEKADAVIGYRTDLTSLNLPGFQPYEIKAEDAPPIFYTGAVSQLAKAPALALDFIQFCASDANRDIWRKDGFDPY